MGLAVALALAPFRGALLGVFGPEFAAAKGALAWLLGAVAIVHIGAPLLTAVVAAGRGSAVLWIAASGLALNLAGNGWLVPHFGMQGAAAATLATEGWVAALAAVTVWKIAGFPSQADGPRKPEE